ncbi:hypothetical protein LXA43DRAFT_1066512 [Ganoderma leucocontextum]|nr:hypothetical protein LXA43DRAFT_1066512 [Ganoderma leucocontextum]
MSYRCETKTYTARGQCTEDDPQDPYHQRQPPPRPSRATRPFSHPTEIHAQLGGPEEVRVDVGPGRVLVGGGRGLECSGRHQGLAVGGSEDDVVEEEFSSEASGELVADLLAIRPVCPGWERNPGRARQRDNVRVYPNGGRKEVFNRVRLRVCTITFGMALNVVAVATVHFTLQASLTVRHKDGLAVDRSDSALIWLFEHEIVFPASVFSAGYTFVYIDRNTFNSVYFVSIMTKKRDEARR